MEENKHDWQSTIIKWQELVKSEAYNKGQTLVQYEVLNHEALVLYCRITGDTKIIKHLII